MHYRKDPKFSDRQVSANSADPDQTAPSLIRVYTVCNSGCIFWVHYSSVKPSCSNFRVITANVLGVRKFRNFKVHIYGTQGSFRQRDIHVPLALLTGWACAFEGYLNTQHRHFLVTKPKNNLCIQQRIRSAWASTKSDHSLHRALYGYLRTRTFFQADSKDSDKAERMPRLISLC